MAVARHARHTSSLRVGVLARPARSGTGFTQEPRALEPVVLRVNATVACRLAAGRALAEGDPKVQSLMKDWDRRLEAPRAALSPPRISFRSNQTLPPGRKDGDKAMGHLQVDDKMGFSHDHPSPPAPEGRRRHPGGRELEGRQGEPRPGSSLTSVISRRCSPMATSTRPCSCTASCLRNHGESSKGGHQVRGNEASPLGGRVVISTPEQGSARRSAMSS